jgi:hypothetical protein
MGRSRFLEGCARVLNMVLSLIKILPIFSLFASRGGGMWWKRNLGSTWGGGLEGGRGHTRTMSLTGPVSMKQKNARRQSSLGMEALEDEDRGVGGPLMNFGLVMDARDREEGVAATNETIAEIERIRGAGGCWDGREGGGGGSRGGKSGGWGRGWS